MKKIVTHKNPHLDEIACIWIIKKFLPGWNTVALRFMPTNPSGGAVKNPDKNVEDTLYIGVGRGKFDEHKGNLADSATTLVFKHVKKYMRPLPAVDTAALEALITYVNEEDHGKHIESPFAEFSISAALANLPKVATHSSQKLVEIGSLYLDGIFNGLQEKFQLKHDWKK